MNLFGIEFGRKKHLSPAHSGNLWWRWIQEPFAGAWQRNKEEKRGDILCYPTLYACISRISQDVAKLPFILKRDQAGIWVEVENPAYSPVLRKPNHFQTAQQFRESWVLSKLTQGNTYALKQRDTRGVVTSLYVLDPWRVMPLVSESGEVFYRLSGTWNLPPLPDGITDTEGDVVVPAREIIHDRANTFHHPLIGVPPLCAAHWPAVKNMRILRNAAEFFGNGAQPGGILTAPAGLAEKDAEALKAYWDANFQGENSGKVAVIGADMKYTAFAMKAVDSQLVEQMRYSDEQICQPFGVKPYKIGISNPPGGWKADDVNVEYYGDALSPIIEAMENLLDEGMDIQRPLGVELDLEPLWRMDEGKQAEVQEKLVKGKIKTPDEARATFNLQPTGGGGTLWGQQQDYPLGVLATVHGREAEQEERDVQLEALNGAQVSSLQALLMAAAAGELPKETARNAIAAAFPLLSPAQLELMIAPIADEPPPVAPVDVTQAAIEATRKELQCLLTNGERYANRP